MLFPFINPDGKNHCLSSWLVHSLVPQGFGLQDLATRILTRTVNKTMNMNMFSVRTFLLFTATLASAADVNEDGLFRENQRRFLRLDQGNQSPVKGVHSLITPQEINVDPLSTYNEKFMTLMNSPCRPELDGFFGATSGDAIRVEYQFRVEVQPLSAIMDILDAIEDRVVDSILQSSFPEMCGLGRTENSDRSSLHTHGHPSGFRFYKFEEAEKCRPQIDEVNFCGIFTGTLDVYGKNQEVEEASTLILSYVNDVLNHSEPRDMHPELSSLSSIDKFYTNQSFDSTDDATKQLSRLDILLIVISAMIVAAVMYYIYLQRKERRYGGANFPSDSKGDPRQDVGIEFEGGSDRRDEFVDEDLNFEPYRDSRKSVTVLY